MCLTSGNKSNELCISLNNLQSKNIYLYVADVFPLVRNNISIIHRDSKEVDKKVKNLNKTFITLGNKR